jgi:ABC-type sugar transport system permease subunit
MASFLSIVYYALLILCLIISGFLFVSNLFSSATNELKRGRITMILASGSALGILFWAYQLGRQQGHFGLGIAAEVSAMVVFAVIMLVGYFTGKTHWQ